MGARLIRLRYRAVCTQCNAELPAGEQGWWQPDNKTVVCQRCKGEYVEQRNSAAPVDERRPADDPTLDRAVVGIAGASARAAYQRRRRNDDEAVLARHPRLGKYLLAVREERQPTKAWAQGAVGEERLGAALNALTSRGASVLHDRRVPGTRANIDHIVVSPSRIWVVDAKRYTGEVNRRDVGTVFRRDVRLYVGRRDCTKLVTGMDKQVAAVRAALESDRPPITPALCFVDAEWRLFARPFDVDGVLVTWPKALVTKIANDRPAIIDVGHFTSHLAKHLPAATS
jgi:hypothetical protein